MRKSNKIARLFGISALFMFITSLTILVMPLSVANGIQNRLFTVFVGLTFWGSAIAGYILIIIANANRKKIMSQMNSKYVSSEGRPGIITFFSNVYATVADTTMIFSFVFFTLINFTELKTSYLAYVFLFLIVLSLHMHCMFNGKVFKAIQVSK